MQDLDKIRAEALAAVAAASTPDQLEESPRTKANRLSNLAVAGFQHSRAPGGQPLANPACLCALCVLCG